MAIVVPSPPAAAEVEGTPIELRLLAQPVFHRPGDSLGIKLGVTNTGSEPLENFALLVEVHSQISSRSALHASFEGSPGFGLGSTSIPFEEMSIGAGERETLDITLRTDELPGLSSATEGGVYPLTLTLGAGGVPLAGLNTPLVYYPEPPEEALNLVLVLPLNDVPSRGADGRFAPDPEGTSPLERAVLADGWAGGLIDNLLATTGELDPKTKRIERPRKPNGRRRPDRIVQVPTRSVHLAIAPTPRFIEEIADLANGYRRVTPDGTEQVRASDDISIAARSVLDRLSSLIQETGVQPIQVPYSFPDLPALTRSLPAERTSLEFTEGAEVLDGALGVQPGTEWSFAPAGRLDGETLASLQRAAGVEHSFFNPDSIDSPPNVVQEGCPQAFASFTCAISVRTTEGPADGFVGDPGLQERLGDLARGGDDRLDLQRFFAETAAIRQELPSVSGRVVHATIPSLWHPSPELSRQLLEGLRTAPWLRTVTPSEGLALPDLETRARTLVPQIVPLEDGPSFDYFNTIEDAAESTSHFELIGPPPSIVQRMVRNTLVAQSRLWWSDLALLGRGVSYAQATLNEIDDEYSKLTLGTPNQIRLTSRQGEIPLVVFNETGYPVTVDIRITSQQLDLELEPSLIEGRRMEPDSTNQIIIKASARSSGIFPMTISLETPDGFPISSKVVTVSSTEFNEVALGITIGAFAFLVLFYVTRAIRRRARAADGST
jgi:hypothetical protein